MNFFKLGFKCLKNEKMLFPVRLTCHVFFTPFSPFLQKTKFWIFCALSDCGRRWRADLYISDVFPKLGYYTLTLIVNLQKYVKRETACESSLPFSFI